MTSKKTTISSSDLIDTYVLCNQTNLLQPLLELACDGDENNPIDADHYGQVESQSMRVVYDDITYAYSDFEEIIRRRNSALQDKVTLETITSEELMEEEDAIASMNNVLANFELELPNEWWLVSPILGGLLRKVGEVVMEAEFGTWWGRKTDGYPISKDRALAQVAEELSEVEDES